MVKDPKSCLVQGHPDNEARILALKPSDSKFNVSLTTTELWRQWYELSWPTSVRHLKLLHLQWKSGQGPMSLFSPLAWFLQHWPHWVLLPYPGEQDWFSCPILVFSILDGMAGYCKKKKKRINCHIWREIQFIVLRRWAWEDALTRPKGDCYLGQFTGSTVWPLPSWVNKFLLSKPWTWLDPEHWLILTMLTETFIKFAAKSANLQWGNSLSSGWMLMSAWPAVDRLHGEPRDQQALQWAWPW